MRYVYLLLNVCWWSIAMSQPDNNICQNAQLLSFAEIPACPVGGSIHENYASSNLGATSSLPDLRLAAFTAGGIHLDVPVSEVWFKFQAEGNTLQLRVDGGIANPVVVLFQALSCDEKWPVAFAKAVSGAGFVELNARLLPGQEYLLMVGGASLDDQGNFELDVAINRECDVCNQRAGSLIADPLPVNGTYLPGQTVQFCYAIDSWDPGFSLEWLHALQLDFGQGWAINTLQPQAPEACTSPVGNWAWYDTWTSCNTQLDFGPGFAFDGAQGLLCPGSAQDNNPGNNFGDGPCVGLDVSPLPLEFCWTLQVKNDLSTLEANSLNLRLTLLGDAYSGSWMPFSCGLESCTDFLATAAPNPVLMPALEFLPATCPGACEGMLILPASSSTGWNYSLMDEAGDYVDNLNATASSGDTLYALCAGNYNLLIQNDAGTVSQLFPLLLAAPETANLTLAIQPACPATPEAHLIAEWPLANGNEAWAWSGPNGFASAAQHPNLSETGIYTLRVFRNNCLWAEDSLEVTSLERELYCEASNDYVLLSWDVFAQDTAFVLDIAESYEVEWLSDNQVKIQNLAAAQWIDWELVVLGNGECGVSSLSSSCQTTACPAPEISAEKSICAGEETSLWVDAPADATIQWLPEEGLSCTDCAEPMATPTSSTVYTASITRADGCSSSATTTVWVDELSPAYLPTDGWAFCPGDPLEICLPEENSYLWISPVGFIQSGDCLTFPYTSANIAGEYTLSIKLADGCRFTQTFDLEALEGDCSDQIGHAPLAPFEGNWTTAAPENDLQLFPNPARQVLNLAFPIEHMRQMSLYNEQGQLLQQFSSADLMVKLDVSHLPEGIYRIQVVDEAAIKQAVFVVSNRW